jgi:16S rRNA (guanine966-N2)-methyltransferase
MRIVSGRLRGKALVAPPGLSTRPTGDRARQAVFNILEHAAWSRTFEGARVIDLFAGSGALGFEALSRGAAFCLFVEESPEARALIRDTVETLQLTGACRIFRRDATDLGPAGTMAPFNLAFLDPPYGQGLGERALSALDAGKWLVPGAIAVLEERANAEIALPQGYVEIDRRSWGDTQALIARYAD